METDEFMEKYQLAIEEIEDIRTKKREEFVRINNAANKVFEQLQPILDEYWVKIEETAMQVIDEYPMSAEDLKREKLKIVYEKLTQKIKENIENKAQLICEQIQNEINVGLSDEASRLQSFEDEFFESINKIQELFSVEPSRRYQQHEHGRFRDRFGDRLGRHRRTVHRIPRSGSQGCSSRRSYRTYHMGSYLLPARIDGCRRSSIVSRRAVPYRYRRTLQEHSPANSPLISSSLRKG